MRYVAGRSFQRQVVDDNGQPIDFWVDTAYREGMEVTTVRFGSDDYFALLDEPNMAEWLSVGPR